jgi:hypothetical protein
VRAAPAVSCASLCKETHTSIQVQRRQSGFPCASGFTAYFVLSPVTGFLATVIKRIRPRNLAPAPGRQDHTTSPSASATLVSLGFRVHRISPRVRDDRDPPLSSGETARAGSADLPDRLSDLFLREGLDRLLVICPSGCFVAPPAPISYCAKGEAARSAPQDAPATGVIRRVDQLCAVARRANGKSVPHHVPPTNQHEAHTRWVTRNGAAPSAEWRHY